MTNPKRLLLPVCLAAFTLASVNRIPQADACSIVGPEPFETDDNEKALDTRAPTMPTIVETTIKRGTAGGCTSGTSCDDIGIIAVTLRSEDDRTASDKMGYRFELVSGEPPKGVIIPSSAVTGYNGSFYFSWIDGNTRGQEDFAFTLRARAVDRGGNESPAIEIAIHNGGRLGCATTGGRSNSGTSLLFMMIFGIHWIRNRRPPASSRTERRVPPATL